MSAFFFKELSAAMGSIEKPTQALIAQRFGILVTAFATRQTANIRLALIDLAAACMKFAEHGDDKTPLPPVESPNRFHES